MRYYCLSCGHPLESNKSMTCPFCDTRLNIMKISEASYRFSVNTNATSCSVNEEWSHSSSSIGRKIVDSLIYLMKHSDELTRKDIRKCIEDSGGGRVTDEYLAHLDFEILKKIGRSDYQKWGNQLFRLFNKELTVITSKHRRS